MNSSGVAALAAALASVGCLEPTGVLDPRVVDLADPWETATAFEVGMDPTELDRAVTRAGAVPRIRGLLIARNGRLVVEQYYGGADANTLFDVRSVTKSVVGTLTGIAVAEGTLPSVNAIIGPYLGAAYTMDQGDSSVTVAQLLAMASGYVWDESQAAGHNDWILAGDHVQYLLDRPRINPGSFTYNSAALHLLGVVVEAAAAIPVADYGADRLFGPIGVSAVAWESLGGGFSNGGSGLDLKGRDLLRFGQLMLQGGRSGERQIVPESWVGAMTAPQYGWRQTFGDQEDVTYGLTWWVSDAAPGAFFAWGYGGQFVYVVPSQLLVIVTATEWRSLSVDGLTAGELANRLFDVIVNNILAAVDE